MNHQRFMKLLKEIEDNGFNDLVFFANAHWLSCGRALQIYCINSDCLGKKDACQVFNNQR